MNSACSSANVLVGVALLTTAVVGCERNTKPPATAEERRDSEAVSTEPPISPPSAPSPPPQPLSSKPTETTPPPEPPPARELLNEAQIFRVSEVVNAAELEQGKLAQSRSKTAKVRAFAATMVKHHGAALREQASLGLQLNIAAEDSATAAKLQAESVKTLDALETTDAKDFDNAYVTRQVEGHQHVLDLIDAQLLPAAKTPAVAEALRRARSFVERHLSEARALQAAQVR